jgi:hypothetical protein
MSKSQAMTAAVQILMFDRNEWVPNNPRLPVLIYPKAIAVQDSDPAALFEKAFIANGGRHNGDTGFIATTTTIPKDMKCLASPAARLG